jgi:hypothetical protein
VVFPGVAAAALMDRNTARERLLGVDQSRDLTLRQPSLAWGPGEAYRELMEHAFEIADNVVELVRLDVGLNTYAC